MNKCSCGFDLEDHWYDKNMEFLCPIGDFIWNDVPPVEEESWTEEDEMLFNTFSEYMNG